MRTRARRAPWFVAGVVGAASLGYLVRALSAASAAGGVGVWDVTVEVVTDARFLVIVCLTTVLQTSVLRREAVLPELVRLGTWRAYLVREARFMARSVLPSAVVVPVMSVLGAVAAGLPWQSRPASGSTALQLQDAGLPGPVAVLAQALLMIVVAAVLHMAMTAIRIASGSVVPVVAAGLLLFCWSSVSVQALATSITPGSSSRRQVLPADFAAGLNTITYVDLPIAIATGLHVVVAGLAATTALSFGAAVALDLRTTGIRRTASTALRHAGQF